MKKFIGYIVCCIGSILMASGQTALKVTDFYVTSDPGIRLFVREITPASDHHHPSILLVHGGFGGLAAFDLPVPGGSFARDLAAKGYKVFIMDVRGSFTKDSTHTTPGDFRRESFYMANGHQYWKAQDIKAPVLVVRGSADFWSRPEDVTVYCEQLINAPYKKCLTIPDGTHFILFDKPAKGRDQLLQEIELFMKQ